MDTIIFLLIALIGCCNLAYATRFLNDKEATSFLSMKRVKRSSSCVIESFCESNYATCSSGSGREVIRENRCNGVSCSFGERCDIQTTYSVCHSSGVQCMNDGTTLRATLITAVFGLGLVVILMVVVTILIVYIRKRKSKIIPQQEPQVKDNEQPSKSNSRTELQPANTNFRNN